LLDVPAETKVFAGGAELLALLDLVELDLGEHLFNVSVLQAGGGGGEADGAAETVEVCAVTYLLLGADLQ